MTIEKLIELEWEGISIEVKKPEELIYLTISTEEYKLQVRANKHKFWVESCYKSELEKK